MDSTYGKIFNKMQRSLQQSKRIQTLIEFDTQLLYHYIGMDKLQFQKLYE